MPPQCNACAAPYISQITPRSAKRYDMERNMDDVVDELEKEEETSEEEDE